MVEKLFVFVLFNISRCYKKKIWAFVNHYKVLDWSGLLEGDNFQN